MSATCPTCGSPQFTLWEPHRGQCFNLACGMRWLVPQDSAAGVMERIYVECHQALIRSSSLSAPTVHSMVGIVPEAWDCAGRFAPAIADAHSALDALKRRTPGRPTKAEAAALEAAETYLDRVQKLATECERVFDGAAGARVCFWTSPTHAIVRITMVLLSGEERSAGAGGLFGHGLVSPPNPARGTRALRGQLLLVPTPQDVLAVQATASTWAAAEDLPPERAYVWCAAIGAPADAAAARALQRMPLMLVPDTPADFSVVDQIRNLANLHLAHPAKGSVAEWLEAEPEPWDALVRQLSKRRLLTRPFVKVRDELDELRVCEGKEIKKFQLDRWVSERVVADLRERGKLYSDQNTAYVLLHDSKEVVPVDVEDERWQYLAFSYGVAPKDVLAKPLAANVTMAAHLHGERTTVYPFAYFDRDRFVVHLFDFKNRVYRISADGITTADNGADGVLFVANPQWEPFQLRLDLEAEGLPCVADHLLDGFDLPEGPLDRVDVVHVLRLFQLAMLMPELFPSRPLLALIGPKGSGKTSLLDFIGKVLFGRNFKVMQLTSDSRDLDASLTTDFYTVADNVDDAPPWFADKLAVVATGGTIKRRQLFTTNSLTEYPIKAWLGLTSRTPSFTREDVADRLLPIHVKRFNRFDAMGDILQNVLANRNVLLTSLARDLQKVLGALRASRGKRIPTRLRLGDFGQYALKVSGALGYAGDTEDLLLRVIQTQTNFVVANEPLFEWLERWLALPGNAGKELTTGNLHADLVTRSDFGICPWETPQEFGRAFDNYRSTLETLYGLKERPGRSGTKLVRLWRTGEERDDGAGA